MHSAKLTYHCKEVPVTAFNHLVIFWPKRLMHRYTSTLLITSNEYSSKFPYKCEYRITCLKK